MLLWLPVGVITGDILIPLFIKDILDILSGFTELDKTILWPSLQKILTLLAFTWGITFMAWRIFEYAIAKFEAQSMRDLERTVYKKLQNHSLGFFANSFTGSLVSKSARFVRGFETVADKFTFDLCSNFIRLIGASIMLYIFVPIVTWILLGWTILFLGTIYLFSIWKLKYDIKNANADSRVTAELADGMTNMSTTKTFARSNFENQRFDNVTQKRFKCRLLCWNLDNIGRATQAFLMIGLEFAIIYISVKMWLADQITVGTIVLIQMYMGAILRNLWNTGRIIRDLYQSFADSEEMTLILNTHPEIKDVKNPEVVKISRGKVEFKEVSFKYAKGKDVFTKFNLKVKAGEKVGVVGESGAGKTTITKLILRFSDIQKGTICIDGQDISKITQEDLRSHIAFVPQEPILFHRSLMENIQYGDLEAPPEAIIGAAKLANAHDFILQCPEGYNTLVGERGIKLSGGERQRIAIARAMLKNAPVLILDEATSSLDSNSEKLIQEALANLMKHRTTIVIAHRLSTIQKMDKILVLEKGEIIEQGSHKELLRLGKKYTELWNHQAGGFIT